MGITVISLGGSIIVPNYIDLKFLKKFKKAILKQKNKIVICTGGGSTARNYISVLKQEDIDKVQLDWMGIEITRVNARLVASFIGDANDMIPRSEEEVAALLEQYDIVVCGGLRPGQTSDGATAMIAMRLKAERIINMTNVDGLFTKDPKKYKGAKFVPKLSHKEFLAIIKKISYKPGQHFVLDKVAADIAADQSIEVVILKGVDNLEKCLQGKKFKGTVIS